MIRVAREKGLSNVDILKALVANEYGTERKKEIIRAWAESLGLENEEALEVARKAALIP